MKLFTWTSNKTKVDGTKQLDLLKKRPYLTRWLVIGGILVFPSVGWSFYTVSGSATEFCDPLTPTTYQQSGIDTTNVSVTATGSCSIGGVTPSATATSVVDETSGKLQSSVTTSLYSTASARTTADFEVALHPPSGGATFPFNIGVSSSYALQVSGSASSPPPFQSYGSAMIELVVQGRSNTYVWQQLTTDGSTAPGALLQTPDFTISGPLQDIFFFTEQAIVGAGNGASASVTDPLSITGLPAGWTYDISPAPAPVPVPPAVWLFGSGLLGLVGVARRKKVSV